MKSIEQKILRVKQLDILGTRIIQNLNKITLWAFESNERFHKDTSQETRNKLNDGHDYTQNSSYYSPEHEMLNVKGLKFKTRV